MEIQTVEGWMDTETAAKVAGCAPRVLERKFRRLLKSRPKGLGRIGRKYRVTVDFLNRAIERGL
jgi:hypothetical protein